MLAYPSKVPLGCNCSLPGKVSCTWCYFQWQLIMERAHTAKCCYILVIQSCFCQRSDATLTCIMFPSWCFTYSAIRKVWCINYPLYPVLFKWISKNLNMEQKEYRRLIYFMLLRLIVCSLFNLMSIFMQVLHFRAHHRTQCPSCSWWRREKMEMCELHFLQTSCI